MALFTSAKEKKLWSYAMITVAAIFLNLFLGNPLVEHFSDQGLQALVFVTVLLLVLAMIIVHGLKAQTRGREVALLLGMAAVFLMFFLRLGLAERSHLVEYSVLALFVYEALSERVQHTGAPKPVWLFAFLPAFGIGIIDECIQLIVPGRVFDYEDIVFNGLAVVMAIAGSMALNAARILWQTRQKQ